MRALKKFSLIFILLILYIFFSLFYYSSNISNSLSNNVFRLHIIANSNSIEDQSLKLQVRDNIIYYLENLCDNCKTKSDYIETINTNINNIKNVALNTISNNNYHFDINVKVGNYFFPTKHYANISFPAGFYDGIKIEIGNAQGKNWWCSLFPPLCFTDISSGLISENDENILKNNISEEELNLIKSDTKTYKIKFKIIEFLNNKNIL